MKSHRVWMIFRITLIYLVVACVWIALSDAAAVRLFTDPQIYQLVSTYKGWGFVVITAFLLAVLLNSELKKQEKVYQDLEASEKRFNTFYENAPVCIQVLDPAGVILEVNQTWSDFLGYSFQKAIGQPFQSFLPSESLPEFTRTLARLNDGFFTNNYELPVLKQDGSIVHALFQGAPFTDSSNRLIRIIMTFQDLSEQNRLLSHSRFLEEEYASILDSVPAMIWYLDRENKIVRANIAAAEMMGSTVDQMIGKPFTDYFPNSALSNPQENLQIIRAQKPVLGEIAAYPTQGGTRFSGANPIRCPISMKIITPRG